MKEIESIVDASAVIGEMQAIVAYAGAKSGNYARLLATEADNELLGGIVREACAYARGIIGDLPGALAHAHACSRLNTALAHYVAASWMRLCSGPDADWHFALAERELRCVARLSTKHTRPVLPL